MNQLNPLAADDVLQLAGHLDDVCDITPASSLQDMNTEAFVTEALRPRAVLQAGDGERDARRIGSVDDLVEHHLGAAVDLAHRIDQKDAPRSLLSRQSGCSPGRGWEGACRRATGACGVRSVARSRCSAGPRSWRSGWRDRV